MTPDEVATEALKLGEGLLPALQAIIPAMGPELMLLDEFIHAVLAARDAENKTREQQVAAERATEDSVLDTIERAEVSKP
jgi:hypothetical protein